MSASGWVDNYSGGCLEFDNGKRMEGNASIHTLDLSNGIKLAVLGRRSYGKFYAHWLVCQIRPSKEPLLFPWQKPFLHLDIPHDGFIDADIGEPIKSDVCRAIIEEAKVAAGVAWAMSESSFG